MSNGSLNIFRIIARDPSGSGEAYAELIADYTDMGSGRVYVEDLKGGHYFAGDDQIVIGAPIIRKVGNGAICRIDLKGWDDHAKDI